MEEAMRAQLLAHAGLAALVGRRIDWDLRPQGDALPGMVLVLTDPGYSYSQDGRGGFEWGRVHAHLYARDADEMMLLRRAATKAFEALAAPLTQGFVTGFWRIPAPVAPNDSTTPILHAVLDVQAGFQN